MIASQIIQAGAYDYIPKDRISVKILSRSINATMEKFRLKKDLNAAHKMMAKMSTMDDLTGLYNRRYFTEALEREISRTKRQKDCFALCIADIDHFKAVNDTYTHLAGDMVLIEMAKILKKHIRSSDLVCRWGGEEFAIILPNTTPKQAIKACEKLRKVTAKKQFKFENAQPIITISIGIAPFDGQDSSSKELLSMADKALYQAKQAGRNKVVIWSNSKETN
jgi:two-component system cell cycle response regulator